MVRNISNCRYPFRFWQNTVFTVALLLLINSNLFCLERKPIVFSLPEGKEEFFVKGEVAFPPSSLKSKNNFRIIGADKKETEKYIIKENLWFDNSIMLLEVGFLGKKAQERSLFIEWGKEVKSTSTIEAKKDIKSVEFKIFDSSSDITIQKSVNVGTMMVQVDTRADIYYYWYLVPILIILGLLFYRKYKTRNI